VKHDFADSRLVGKTGQQRSTPGHKKLICIFSEDFSEPSEEKLDVVGEAYFQPVIWDACGTNGKADLVRFSCYADLIPQPDNRYDARAIMVEINGKQVGYLSRDATQRFSSAIADAIAVQRTSRCEALLTERRFQKNFLDVYVYLNIKPKTEGEHQKDPESGS
jgi:hypothetical protein